MKSVLLFFTFSFFAFHHPNATSAEIPCPAKEETPYAKLENVLTQLQTTNATTQVAWFDTIVEAVSRMPEQTESSDAVKQAAGKEKAGQLFTALLKHKDKLLACPLKPPQKDGNLKDIDDAYRKTVYDFCVWKAIEFYGLPRCTEGEANTHVGLPPDADIPIFSEPEVFMSWAETRSADSTNAPTTHASAQPRSPACMIALKLVAGEMRRHQKSGDMLSYADADFHRLKLAYEIQRKSKDCEFEFSAALEKYIGRWEKNELSARARALQALRLNDKIRLKDYAQLNDTTKYAEAIRIAEKGMDTFPKSIGARECYRSIQHAKNSYFSFSTKSVWSRTKPEARPHGNIRIYSQNIRKAFFRLYPITPPEIPESSLDPDDTNGTREQSDKARLIATLAIQPAYQWEVAIASTNLQHIKFQYDVTNSFKSGTYLLVGSTQQDFRYDQTNPLNNHLMAGVIQVTDMSSFVTREAETSDFRILNLETGLPVPQAIVTKSSYEPGATVPCLVTNGVTDLLGTCRIAHIPDSFESVVIRKGSDVFTADLGQVPKINTNINSTRKRVLLLTDRAVYRPGQTVRYKGIYYSTDTERNKYAVLPNVRDTLSFLDNNGKLIESCKIRSNDFGSFSGLFAIPTDRGPGEMKLQIADATVAFRVEERAPALEVIFEPIQQTYKIGDTVKVTGRAVYLSGQALTRATIKWDISQSLSYPQWYTSERYYLPRFNPEITKGDASLRTDGTFVIEFPATCDPTFKLADVASITYTISAQVTDVTGEARECLTWVTAKGSAFQLKIETDEWFTENTAHPVILQTTNVKGEPTPAQVDVTLYALTQPARPTPFDKEYDYNWYDYDSFQPQDPNDIMLWPAHVIVTNTVLTTDQTGLKTLHLSLTAGVYRIEGVVKDATGNTFLEKATVKVINPVATRYPICQPVDLIAKKSSYSVGETIEAVWGSGYSDVYGAVEARVSGRCIKRFEIRPPHTQVPITFPVTEDLQGGFTLCSELYKEGVLWVTEKRIDVPWSSKKLNLYWTNIKTAPEPNTQETWSLSVKNPDGSPADAEVVVCMYDAAGDLIRSNNWSAITDFRQEGAGSAYASYIKAAWLQKYSEDIWFGDTPIPLLTAWTKYENIYPWSALYSSVQFCKHRYPGGSRGMHCGFTQGSWNGPRSFDDLVAYQKDPWLNRFPNPSETAFFRVAMRTDNKGEVSFSFKVPNIYARWSILALAHDKQLASGLIQTNCVTEKKILLAAQLPRFLRTGDALDLSVNVINRDSQPQKGAISLSLTEAPSGRSAMHLIKEAKADRPFSLALGSGDTATWRLTLPADRTNVLNYALCTKDVADGWRQEGTLPVLPRILNTNTPSKLIVPEHTEQLTELFHKNLLSATKSLTNAQTSYSGAIHYPVLVALPDLLEAPLENSEQLFHRYYATTIARLLLQRHPDLTEAFNLWRTSNKKEMADWSANAHYRAMVREEAPSQDIVLDAKNQMFQMAMFFDLRQLATEQQQAFSRLKGCREDDGLWPWFIKGPEDPFFSLTVLQGFVRLRQLGVNTIDQDFLAKFITSMDNWYLRHAKSNRSEDPQRKDVSVSPEEIYFLSVRSALLADFPCCWAVENLMKENIRCATADAKSLPRLSRAHLAIALNHIGNVERAVALVHTLRDEALCTPEDGMYWKTAQRSSAWFEAPVETQTAMIEAFLEVTKERDLAEKCSRWLMAQNSSGHWDSPLATAHATYALLRCAPTASSQLKQPTIDTAKKSPFHLTRTFFKQTITENGMSLQPTTNSLCVGDILLTRLEVVSEEEMDYVHILDARAANTEPLSPLTSHRETETLAYTLMPGTTATHFFITRLPKGRHTFEHACRITHNGSFSNGSAFIQCHYAPEFNAQTP